MNPYRVPEKKPVWFVEANVRGPLSSFLLGAVVEALDEQGALERFERDMNEAGFELLSEPKIHQWPSFNLTSPLPTLKGLKF